MPVKLIDVIVPSIFTPYIMLKSTEKVALLESGAMTRSAWLDRMLLGAGLTFNVPAFKPLANDSENISSDDDTVLSTPKKIGTTSEIAVRLNRNSSWSSMDLVNALIAEDPLQVIASQVADYWRKRLQAAFIATMTGVFADNAAAPTGTEHVQNDLTHNISGASYSAGVTDFNASAVIDAVSLMGDRMDEMTTIMMHSLIYARALKNNLIDFIPDSEGKLNIPTFLGLRVVVDDGMPNPSSPAPSTTGAGIFHTWIFGPNVMQFGAAPAEVPTEVERKPDSGNGGGQEVLYSRVQWALHPTGHKYAVASPANGGPSNASTAGNLAHADSWQRVYPERKMIKVARLVTRES